MFLHNIDNEHWNLYTTIDYSEGVKDKLIKVIRVWGDRGPFGDMHIWRRAALNGMPRIIDLDDLAIHLRLM